MTLQLLELASMVEHKTQKVIKAMRGSIPMVISAIDWSRCAKRPRLKTIEMLLSSNAEVFLMHAPTSIGPSNLPNSTVRTKW
jgi:hypothetical protein